MAKSLETIKWNDLDIRDPQNVEMDGWENLEEPIDVDIDEDIFV